MTKQKIHRSIWDRYLSKVRDAGGDLESRANQCIVKEESEFVWVDVGSADWPGWGLLRGDSSNTKTQGRRSGRSPGLLAKLKQGRLRKCVSCPKFDKARGKCSLFNDCCWGRFLSNPVSECLSSEKRWHKLDLETILNEEYENQDEYGEV